MNPQDAPYVRDPARLAALRATALLGSPPEAAFDRLTRLASRVVRAPVALVSLIDERRQFFKSSVGLAEPWASARETPLSHSFCLQVVATRAPFVVADAPGDPRVRDNRAIPEMGVAAYAGVPIVAGDAHVIGALCVIDVVPREWRDEELDTLDELAAAAATEIELRRAARTLAAQAEALRERERALREHSAVLASVLDNMVEGVVVADADGRIRSFNAALERMLERTVADGPPEAWPAEYAIFEADGAAPCTSRELPLGRALRGETVERREFLVRTPGAPAGRWHEVSASPIRDPDGTLLGAVSVSRDVTERKLVAAQLAQQAEAIRALSLRDELTGLYNRRGFLELGAQHLRVAARARRGAVVLFADLNGLKPINDTLGHDEGDRALRDAAGVLRAAFRDADLVARLGGDEFVVLATDASAGVAPALLARLHDAADALNASGARAVPLSFSAGTAAFDPEQPRSLEALLAAADEAMYAHKRALRAAGRAPTRQG